MSRVFVAVVVFLVLPTAVHGQYVEGFVWDREADWTPGTVAASQVGNPDDDQMGNPVWNYNWVTGGGHLTSSSPWYASTGSRMYWDPFWFGSPDPDRAQWQRHSDSNGDGSPAISKFGLTHVQSDFFENENLHFRTPQVQWINPTGMELTVEIAGTVRVGWGPANANGPNTSDVDVAIAHGVSGVSGRTLIFGESLARPEGEQFIEFDVSPTRLTVGPSDDIVFTVRARDAIPSFLVGGSWVTIADDFSITIVEDILDGDYDVDGDVDGADFLEWQRDFGMTGTNLASDGNGNGIVDAADYTVWRDNFGSGATATSTSVPEPSTIGLSILGAGTFWWKRRRFRTSTRKRFRRSASR